MEQSLDDERNRLWQDLGALRAYAARLRVLSQRAPLVQRRPDYPHAGLERSHDDEVRELLGEVQRRLDAVRTALGTALSAAAPPGIAEEERRDALIARAEALGRLAAALDREAFQPLPALPPHAPPYLVEPPGHDLAGTKAVLLAVGLEALTASARTLVLASSNAAPAR